MTTRFLDDEQVSQFAGSEVLSWDLNRIPFAVSESQGPLTVKLHGDVVKRYRWWHHPRFDGRRLYVCDTRSHMRVIDEYEPEQYDEVIHDWLLAGVY